MRTNTAVVAISIVLSMSGCNGSPNSPAPTTSTPNLINPNDNAARTMTVRFKQTTTAQEMDSVAKLLDSALLQGDFADFPAIEVRHEESAVTIGWRSAEAAERGEDRVRELLAGSALVEGIES